VRNTKAFQIIQLKEENLPLITFHVLEMYTNKKLIFLGAMLLVLVQGLNEKPIEVDLEMN
jgi:hypothetical protein